MNHATNFLEMNVPHMRVLSVWACFMCVCFMCACCVGVSLSVHTMYLVECAPKRLRGMVGVSVATFVSLGKFSGQLLGLR